MINASTSVLASAHVQLDIAHNSLWPIDTIWRLISALIARFMGQHGAHPWPTGPRRAPCWPHEPCYLGGSSLIQVMTWYLTAPIHYLSSVDWKNPWSKLKLNFQNCSISSMDLRIIFPVSTVVISMLLISHHRIKMVNSFTTHQLHDTIRLQWYITWR